MPPPAPSQRNAAARPRRRHRALFWAVLTGVFGVAGCEPMRRPSLPSDGDGARIEHLAAAGVAAAPLDAGRPE